MELRSDATMALELLALVAGVVLLLWSGKEARKWQTVGVVAGWYVIGAAALLFVGTGISAVGSFGSQLLMQRLPMIQIPGMSVPQDASRDGRGGAPGRGRDSRSGAGRQTAPVDPSTMQEFMNHPMMKKMQEMMQSGGMGGGGSAPVPGQAQPPRERE